MFKLCIFLMRSHASQKSGICFLPILVVSSRLTLSLSVCNGFPKSGSRCKIALAQQHATDTAVYTALLFLKLGVPLFTE